MGDLIMFSSLIVSALLKLPILKDEKFRERETVRKMIGYLDRIDVLSVCIIWVYASFSAFIGVSPVHSLQISMP
jgi:hypothetical protein